MAKLKKPGRHQQPLRKRKTKKRHLDVDENTPLTEPEQLFKVAYLVHLNASAAYKQVKPNAKNSTCRTEGCIWLAKPNIRKSIDNALTERKRKLQITADAVLEEYRRIGFSNMHDYLEYSENGNITMVESGKLSPEQMAAISEVSLTDGDKSRSFRFRLHSKIDALQALAQHTGALKPMSPLIPAPGDPGTLTHFHTTIPFDEIKKKAEAEK